MKRCAIYARYSSDLQSPTSIEDQIALCRTEIARRGWIEVAKFEDAALSGDGVERRTGYHQLMAAALSPSRPFDVVVVEALSRLSREISESDMLYRRLRKREIDLVGVSDGVDTTRQGAAAQIALHGVMNALYLDSLRAATHRGLSGSVARGMSAGGKIFGYRTVSVADAPRRSGKRTLPARFEVNDVEAEIIHRIFREYAAGRSSGDIVHGLNHEGVPFPAKDTKRGPARRGWAKSTLAVILRNEKYVGVWIWNKTRFLKDPDTGRRGPVPRPPDEWTRQERPELRIVDDQLWRAVQERLAFVKRTFASETSRLPRGARLAYSRFLFSGFLRCANCGARMVGQTTTRKKPAGSVHLYGWYRCAFAREKGPAVCAHGVSYRQDKLERALLEKFRAATTPAMIDAMAAGMNAEIEATFRRRDARGDEIKAEVVTLERQAGNLARFIAEGGLSTTVRDELASIESALTGLRIELAATSDVRAAIPRVHRNWVAAKVERLHELLQRDVAGARAEIAKHLDGDLTLSPLPDVDGKRRCEIRGRAKANSLLPEQEAVCVPLVAGAGFEPATFGL